MAHSLELFVSVLEKNIDNRGKTPPLSPTGYPLIEVKHIQQDRLYPVFEDTKYVDQETWNTWFRAHLEPDDILFSTVGSIARSCMVPKAPKFCIAQNVLGFRVDRAKADPRFLYYAINDSFFQHEVHGRTIETVQKSIKVHDLKTCRIPLPPIQEQKAIAAVLGALDDKIELNRRMNATLEAMARALFQSWFVDFDPVRAKINGRKPAGMDSATADLFSDSFQESPVGKIPHGWSVRDLGELADIDKGLSYKGEGLAEEGGMPMVNLGCFSGRGLFNAERIKQYKGEYRDRHLVHSGDLVIANTDMTQNRVIIGSPALVPELDGAKEFLFTHHVFAVRFKPDAKIWRRYVFFTLLKPEFREIAEGFSTGTTVLALPRDGLLNYSLCLPSVSLLAAFERQIGPILDAVDANHRQSRTLATLRDTLLPKLLSGEVRVPEAESLAA